MTDVFRGEVDGLSALALVPTIREDLPAEIREALARRRLVSLGQTCPCGAKRPGLSRHQRRAIEARNRRGLPGEVFHITVEHENDCPAVDANLAALIAEHGVDPRTLM